MHVNIFINIFNIIHKNILDSIIILFYNVGKLILGVNL